MNESLATNEQTLVLDQSYQPIDIIPWARAVTMWFEQKVEIIAEYDGFVRSSLLVIKVPAVVRLLNKLRLKRKPVKFSRVNIYARDGYKCQYCGHKFKMYDLTYDHVIPRSQGGTTTWTNIVSACSDCNSDKAGRTPEQAKMKLLKKPVQPIDVPALMIHISRSSTPDQWRDYLYWTAEFVA
jgi:5-methylcytosine-specific restriction endonuclease McrA